MATMKFKRSAVPSKVPTTFDLALGEFALNTFDGKLYAKGENSSGEFVFEISGGSGGGGGTWGSITGTLSDQTDLQSALNAKLGLSGGALTGPLSAFGGITAGNQTNATVDSGFLILRPLDATPRTFAIVENDTELRIGGGAWTRINLWAGAARPVLSADDTGAVTVQTSLTVAGRNILSDIDGKAPLSHTHTSSNITDFAEAVDDRVAALLVEGSGIVLDYNDTSNTLTVSVDAAAGVLANWVKVAEVDITTPVPTVEVLGLSAYQDIRVVYESLTVSSTGQRAIQLSSDNGATFDTTFTNYGYLNGASAATYTVASGTTGFFPSGAIVNTAQNAVVELKNFGIAANTVMESPLRAQVYVHFPKVAQNALRVTNINSGAVAGNLTGGKVIVYGLPKAIAGGASPTWGTIIGALADQTDLQAALNAKASLASPALTGTPTAPTAAVGTNTTQLATTAFVQAEIANDAPTKTGGGASGTWGIAITGNAASASVLQTARTITLAGDATGSVSFNGGSNVTLTVGVVDNSHAHTIANVTGLQTALDGKLNLAGGTMTGALSVPSGFLVRKQGSEGGEMVLQKGDTMTTVGDIIIDAVAGYIRFFDNGGSFPQFRMDFATGNIFSSVKNANVSYEGHTHTIAQVTGLQTALDGKLSLSGGALTGALDVGGLVRSVSGAQNLRFQHDGTNGTVASSTQLLFYADGANGMVFHTNGVNRFSIAAGGASTFTGDVTAPSFSVGDDITIEDFNVGNALRLKGKANTDRAFIQFGDGASNLLGCIGTGDLTFRGVALGTKNVPLTVTTGQTATIAAIGGGYLTSGNITVPSATFAQGDIFTVINNSGTAISIVQGSGMTLRLVGTATTGSRTLAQRGIATVIFVSASEAIVTGVT